MQDCRLIICPNANTADLNFGNQLPEGFTGCLIIIEIKPKRKRFGACRATNFKNSLVFVWEV